MIEVIKLLAFAALLGGIAAGSHRVGYVAGSVDAAIRRGTEASPVKTGGGRANAVCPTGVGERADGKSERSSAIWSTGRGFGLAAKERDGREAPSSKLDGTGEEGAK